MKLSDYIAEYLADLGIRHVFVVSGGASIHMIHSIADTPGIDYICAQHEQAGAMAADCYSRVTGNLGAAVGTSGPGATNMITGVCCAYYDSVPVIYITGQVATFRMKRDSGVRQLGFQESDTTDIFRSFTNYAVTLEDPQRIRFELDKAVHLATTGRPGPVLVEIPDDLARAEVDPDSLEQFLPEVAQTDSRWLDRQVDSCIQLINDAHRPVLILGWGVRLAKGAKEAEELAANLGFPVLPTWAVIDMFPVDHPLLVGSFGTHGIRAGNFAVQNADLILSVGARLDTHEAGSPITSFARDAKKIVVDIDPFELGKFKMQGLDIELPIQADAGEFLKALNGRVAEFNLNDTSPWHSTVAQWKAKYPVCAPEYHEEEEVNPYVFVKGLSEKMSEEDVIIVDTGCAVAWMSQAFEFKAGQRLIHDFNNTAMGYALPASIAASLAGNGHTVACVTGDGSLQMNIQELATVIAHKLPIKIFLLNNHGHSMIQQTQDQWLDSRYIASSVEGGLAFPDFVAVAKAYGFKTISIESNRSITNKIREAIEWDGPVFCNVEIRPQHRVLPQVKFGRPIEDSEPLLDREEFLQNMIVSPMKASLEST